MAAALAGRRSVAKLKKTVLSVPTSLLSPAYQGVNFPQGGGADLSGGAAPPYTSDPYYTSPLGFLYHAAYFNTAESSAGLHSDISYFRGLPNYNICRISVLWERLQPTLGAALNSTHLANLTTDVNAVTSRGAVAIVDIHNYGAYPSGSGNLIGGSGPSAAQYNDLMTRVATAFKTNPLVWLDPMNEPVAFPGGATEWAGYIQGAINAIRTAGFTNYILVPGINYTGAHSWVSSGSAAALVSLTDSANKLIYQVHQYADHDYSGQWRGELVSETIYPETLAAVTAWAEANGKLLFLGEWNTDRDSGNQARGERALTLGLKYMQAHSCWIGHTLWQGGPMGVDDLYTTWNENDPPTYTKPSRHDRAVRALMVTGSTVSLPSATATPAGGTLSGTATEGNTLGVTGVSWSHAGNADLGYEELYQWQIAGSTPTDIIGADGSTIPLSLPLVGKTVRRGTYAKNIGGTAATVYTAASSTVASGTLAELFEQTTSVPDATWIKHPNNVFGSYLAAGSLNGTPNGANGVFAYKGSGYVFPNYVYEVSARASGTVSNMIFQVGIDETTVSANSYGVTQVNLTSSAFTNFNGTGPDSPLRQGTTTVTTVGSEKLIKQQFSFPAQIRPIISIGIAASSPGGTINLTLVSIKCISAISSGGGTLGPELLTHTVPGGTGWTASPFNVGGSSVSSGTFSGTPNGAAGALATDPEASVTAGHTYELSSQASANASNVIYRIGVDDPLGGGGGYAHIYTNLTTGAFTYNNSGNANQPAVVGTSTVTTVGSEKLIKIRLQFVNSGTPNFVAGLAETSPAGTVTVSNFSFKEVT
jgi:hypothetical protein